MNTARHNCNQTKRRGAEAAEDRRESLDLTEDNRENRAFGHDLQVFQDFLRQEAGRDWLKVKEQRGQAAW